jgi:drug/metabolite transporter (DMT)-like permease
MSTAEWNVLGLMLALVGMLLLFRSGLPKSGQRAPLASWFGAILLIAGTLCQIWANVRWIG